MCLVCFINTLEYDAFFRIKTFSRQAIPCNTAQLAIHQALCAWLAVQFVLFFSRRDEDARGNVISVGRASIKGYGHPDELGHAASRDTNSDLPTFVAAGRMIYHNDSASSGKERQIDCS
jgi:hypothetical protein